MKKISYFLVLQLAIATTYLIVTTFNVRYTFNLENFLHPDFDDQSTYSFMYQENMYSAVTSEELMETLKKASDENEVTFRLIVGYSDDMNRNVMENYIYSSSVEIEDLFYTQNSNRISWSDGSENTYYSTNRDDSSAVTIQMLDESYASGLLYPLLYFRPLHQIYERPQKDLYYVIYFYGEGSNIRKVRDEVVDTHGQIQAAQFLKVDGKTFMPDDSIRQGTYLSAGIALILLIILIGIINQHLKEVSVRKMMGHSDGRIQWRILGEFFLSLLLVYVSTLGIMYWFFVGDAGSIGSAVYKGQLKILAYFATGLLAVFAGSYAYVKYISSALYLKRKSTYKVLLYGNLAVKILIFILVITPLLTKLEDGYRSFRDVIYRERKHDTDLLRYNVSLDIPMSDFDRIMKMFGDAFEISEKENALLADFNDADLSLFEEFNMELEPNTVSSIVVNTEYLQDYKILHEDGTVLDLETLKGNTMLVPLELKGKPFTTVSQKEHPKIYVKFQEPFYNPDISKRDHFKVKDPVVFYMKEYDASGMQTLYGAVYYSDLEGLRESFEAAGYKDALRVTDLRPVYDFYMGEYKQEALESLYIFALYLSVVLILLYEIIYLHLEEKKQLISIQYLLGKSYGERYKNLYLMSLISYAVLIPYSMIMLKLSSVSLLMLFGILILLEMVLVSSMIKRFESTDMVKTIKGA